MGSHIKNAPSDIINKMLYANELISSDVALAIKEFKSILLIDENNVITLNNLAWYLFKQNKLEEAFVHAQKARSLLPNNKNILNTYNEIKIALDEE